MGAPKLCGEVGCGEVAEVGPWCGDHYRERQAVKAARRAPGERSMPRNWNRTRAIQLRDFPLCARCGKPATQAHHKRDRDAGGTDHPSNLESLCDSCHSSHTAATKPAGWNAFTRSG